MSLPFLNWWMLCWSFRGKHIRTLQKHILQRNIHELFVKSASQSATYSLISRTKLCIRVNQNCEQWSFVPLSRSSSARNIVMSFLQRETNPIDCRKWRYVIGKVFKVSTSTREEITPPVELLPGGLWLEFHLRKFLGDVKAFRAHRNVHTCLLLRSVHCWIILFFN